MKGICFSATWAENTFLVQPGENMFCGITYGRKETKRLKDLIRSQCATSHNNEAVIFLSFLLQS